MNKKQKILSSILVLAILAFSAAAVTMVHASGPSSPPWTSYATMPWYYNQLVTAGTLTVAGSSTVGPIASEEIGAGNFVSYFNSLDLGTTISSVSLSTLGSGTAIPALDGSGGTADVGEMSRPPQDSEWGQSAMTSMQIWAIGIDSVAIVVSPDMTWFPTSLTTNQVVALFADNNPAGTQSGGEGLLGATGTTPLYATWDDWLNGVGLSSYVAAAGAAGNQQIQLAVRDPTSGTFDCFNNYFAVPNGYNFEYKAVSTGIGTPGQPGYVPPSNGQKTVVGTQEIAPFTYCEENQDIINTVEDGQYLSTGDYVGFCSLGYAIDNPHTGTGSGDGVIPLNIAFNMASPPSGDTASPLITYYGSSGTYGFVGSTVSGQPTWGSYVQPTDPNVKYAVSGIKGSAATGAYEAWRWLWEVTPGPIPTSGPCLAAGVWIAYMIADGTLNSAGVATTPGTGTTNFVAEENYIPLSRADFAGALPIDSNLVPSGTAGAFTVTATQTQTIPTGGVSPTDFIYFVNAYIHSFLGTYNPFLDYYATGTINISDFTAFVNAYIQYYVSYNP